MTTQKKLEKVKGSDISKLDTIYSMYANGNIVGKYQGKVIKIPVSTLELLLKDYDFEFEQKKVHKYLVNPTKRQPEGWALGK